MKKKSIIDEIIDSALIKENSVVIVGFSGGPDSLCLLHALVQIQDAYNLEIVPVHVNHKLRAAADEEAENAAMICDRLGLECMVFEAECQELADEMKMSTEEAGRMIRYDIFDDVAAEFEAQGVDKDSISIAVAHNADDQSETVLFRLLRGTGVHGLAGMSTIRVSEEGYFIIRPLLDVERVDIEKYIADNRLRPNRDESNDGTDYTRNKIRNELIPYLEKNYNPNIKQALRRYAEIAEVDDQFIEDIAVGECAENLVMDPEKDVISLDIGEIRDYPPAVNSRIVGIILKALDLDTLAGYELVVSILNLIYSENPSASVNLPRGFRAIREYDYIIFTDNEEVIAGAHPEGSRELRTQVIMA